VGRAAAITTQGLWARIGAAGQTPSSSLTVQEHNLLRPMKQQDLAEARKSFCSRPIARAGYFASVEVAGFLLFFALLSPTVAHASCQITAVELPVTMSGPRPLVTAKINDADVNFILDSGAFFSTISPAAAEQFKLPHRRPPDGLRVDAVGGRAEIYATRVKEFTLTTTVFSNVDFIVGGNELDANAIGLLGQNVLGLADVEYDLGNGSVRIVQPGEDCKSANLAYWAGSRPYSEIDLERSRWKPNKMTTAIAHINGVEIHVEFDTGAQASFLSLQAAKRAGLVPGGEGVIAAGASRGMGRAEVQTWIAPVKNFTIGDEQIKNTHLRIGDLDLGDIDMLLGADFFLSHRIYVANGREKIYFTYNGGPAFDLSVVPNAGQRTMPDLDKQAVAEEQSPGPTDAKGYARRGAARASRRDFTNALADMTRACELDPGVGRYFLMRGQIRVSLGQANASMPDFNEAIRLSPDDLDARLARARTLIAIREGESTRADLEVADRIAASQSNSRLEIADLYMRLDMPEAALGQYNHWIASHDEDVNLKVVLAGRCWARALIGTELGKALVDCDAAVKSNPQSAEFLSSRGLVHLRMGEFDKAMDDYDAALRINPKIAWSLFGRGVVRLHKGAADAANVDITAAKALRPSIVADAKRHGIE
jgi:tetratricopeptide (TPR) repeat protein